MPLRSLSELLSELEQRGELRRVSLEVSAEEELAEITARVARAENYALLFEHVAGHRLPVVTNLFGTERRICLALQVHSISELVERFRGLLLPQSMNVADRSSGTVAGTGLTPKRMKTAPCQQVVRLGSDIDLAQLPIPKLHRNETHRAFTAAVVHWRDPANGQRRYDHLTIEVLGCARLGLHTSPSSQLSQRLREATSRGEHVPLAVTLGSDASTLLTALVPALVSHDAAIVAASLRGAAGEIVTCRTHDLDVPADAELVCEGHIDPQQQAQGTALATDLGWCSEARPLAILELAAVTHRTNPILTAAIVGAPPHELCAWRHALHQLVQPLLQQLAPEVVDYHFPDFGAARDFAFVAIRKSYPQQAHKVASLLGGLDPWAATRFVVVVDEQVDVHDSAEVWRHVAANTHALRDLSLHSLPTSPADQAAPQPGIGGRVLIDATAKLAGEHPRPWPPEAERSPAVAELVSGRWQRYGLH